MDYFTAKQRLYPDVVQEPVASYGHGNRYLDLRYDFCFKYIFGLGTELLTDLLNSLFEGRKTFEGLQFGTIEHLGETRNNRAVQFDLQCTAGGGEQLFIEMQRQRQDNFLSRLLFYTSKLITGRIPAGKTGKNFVLPEIHGIAFVDFDPWQDFLLPPCLEKEYINQYTIRHVLTGDRYPIRLELTIVELPKFHKSRTELRSRQDKWLYLLKNLHSLEEPLFEDDPIFSKLFERIEKSKLNQKDKKMLVDYELDRRNIEDVIRRETRAETIEQEKQVFATTLITETDFNDGKIASITGIEEEQVGEIRTRTAGNGE